MNYEELERHKELLLERINDYRAQSVSLNSLIMSAETISNEIESPKWKEHVLPIIYDIEIVNAQSLENSSNGRPTKLSREDHQYIEEAVLRLISAIQCFEYD